MSKSNAFETALLALIFQNANIANLGDATGVRGSTAVGQLFLSLHTADPGEAGDQTTSEVTYTGYSRVGLARTSGNFSLSGNQINLVANTDFPACTAGTMTATHFAIGLLTSGAGMVLYKGAMTPTIAIAPGVTPRLTPTTNVTED